MFLLVLCSPTLFTRDEFFKEMGIFTESEMILSILAHISSMFTTSEGGEFVVSARKLVKKLIFVCIHVLLCC